MISGAPSQDSLLPDNRHAADYQQLRERLIQELNLTPQQLHEESNLIQAGLDSIRLMRWLHWFRKNGYRLTLRELYAAPTLAAWNQLMLSRSPENAEEETPPDESSWPNMTESTPFPLTPVQHAYLTGRMPGQTLGGVGCHLYQEFEGHCLTASQLEQAITTLLQRHPMLHIAFRPDGQQVWLPQPYWNGVTVHDLRHNDAESRQAYLDALRQRLSHRLLRVEIGETFDFQLTLLPDNRHRLHVNIDLLIMDASSFTLFFDELNALLAGESLPAIDTRYDFRSYLLHQQKINQPLRDVARAYWLAKASTLPPAPVLPLACEPATLREVRNTRRRMIVPATRWHAFSNRAGEYGVTPTMALATCFSAVLARWGGLTRLLLNITLFTASRCNRRLARCLPTSPIFFCWIPPAMAIPSATWRVKTSSRLRRTGSIATGPASNYSVNSNASSATPTAPRWYLPAIWGVPSTAAAQNRRWASRNGASRKRRRSG